MHDKYQDNLAAGKKFEEIVADVLLHNLNWGVGIYRSQRFQALHGESKGRVECKLDRKFRETGNLFIETAESFYAGGELKPAGILHKCCPLLLAIGDTNKFWLISVKHLRAYHSSGRLREVTTETSQGMLLPLEDADEIAILPPFVQRDEAFFGDEVL